MLLFELGKGMGVARKNEKDKLWALPCKFNVMRIVENSPQTYPQLNPYYFDLQSNLNDKGCVRSD